MNTYIFDFDGTLIDSMPWLVKMLEEVLEKSSLHCDGEVIKNVIPLGYKRIAEHFVKIGAKLSYDEIILLMYNLLRDNYFYNIPLKNNAREVLEKLNSEGASLNILTASPHDMIDRCIERLDIGDLFCNIWSCDEFGTNKADHKIYEMAAERLNVPISDIMFVDDNYNVLKTAKEAGMRTCGIYDISSKDYIDDIKATADHYVYDFSEFYGIK